MAKNGTEPMLKEIADGMDVDDDVKRLTMQYLSLSKDDREIVKKLINSLAERIKRT